MKQNGQMRKQTAILAEREKNLLALLSPQDQALLHDMIDAHGEMELLIARENFIDGLRLGAGMILELLDDNDGEYTPMTDEA